MVVALLTPRERQVLTCIVEGYTNKETGRILGISPRTVEVHRARVMEKLGARNTADLIRLALNDEMQIDRARLSVAIRDMTVEEVSTKQFNDFAKVRGLNAIDLAYLLGKPIQTIESYMTGSPVPTSIALALRQLDTLLGTRLRAPRGLENCTAAFT